MCTLKNKNVRGMITNKIIRNFIIGIITGLICGIAADITGKNIVVAVWFVFIIARSIFMIGETKTLIDILLIYSTEDEP